MGRILLTHTHLHTYTHTFTYFHRPVPKNHFFFYLGDLETYKSGENSTLKFLTEYDSYITFGKLIMEIKRLLCKKAWVSCVIYKFYFARKWNLYQLCNTAIW